MCRKLLIIRQILEAKNVTDELKGKEQIGRVRAMSGIHGRAKEIVVQEIIIL